jgi:mRNA interferase RelE/StbE
VYRVLITPQAQRQLENLPPKQRGQVERRILDLGRNPLPPGVKALHGRRFQGLHRTRSGDYRIVYQVRTHERAVVVVLLGDRKDVYR